MRNFLVMCLLFLGFELSANGGYVNRLPTPQSGHHILEVGSDHSVWLFPGFSGETILPDIHVFTETGWQKKMVMPFADRTWYSATNVPDFNQVLFFGGKTMDRKPFDETWLWNGKAFSKYSGLGPSARSHHTATFDPYRKVVVVFGGDAGGNLLNDVWEWNGAVWKHIQVTGELPQPRAAHMAAFDPINKRVIVVGGVHSDNQTRFQDAWAWNGAMWQRLQDLPKPLAAAAMGSSADNVFLVGGWSQGFESINQVYQLSETGWKLIEQDFGPRSFSTVSYLEYKDKLILSGGMDSDFNPRDDIQLLSEDL